ncbi:MAG: ATP-dependent DNA helicase [Candidatus Eisenbacteria bacterium]|nr:ATP-dependent DNA helicase [Candidatus Eisenbacteria bacterium]
MRAFKPEESCTVVPQEDILAGLNEAQRQAVVHDKGPLLIVAGAGTGKTSVVVRRIAHLIASKRANPGEIMALTFTDKAAAEMEERVDVLVPYGYTDVWISTFHAFGDRVLREHALEMGLTPEFKVLTQPEQIIFLREHLFEFPLSYYRPLSDPTKFISAMVTVFSRAKDEDVSPAEYLDYARALAEQSRLRPEDEELRERARKELEIADCYQLYQDLMTREGNVDFGDQVNLTLRLFRTHPTVLRRYRERFRYILVDEFQDTNYAQFELVKLLAGEGENVTVVGDDDQSIYKFRGAAISNILGFMDAYPQAKQIVLTTNYRTPQSILDCAYRLIRFNNPDRLEVKNSIDKRLVSTKDEARPPEHLHLEAVSSEADVVAKLIEEKVASGKYAYKDFAILVRSNNDADPFLRALNMRGVPHRFSGSRGLYGREEVRLLISFLHSIADFDDSPSLYYLAGSEIYGTDQVDLVKLNNFARRRNLTLHEVFELLTQTGVAGETGRAVADPTELPEVSEDTQRNVRRLMSDIRRYLMLSREKPAGEILYGFITDTGYLRRLSSEASSVADEQIRNIAKFFDMLRAFASVSIHDDVHNFVAHLDMLAEAGDNPAVAEADLDVDAVNALTIHKAKGLEFRVVFLVSLVSQRFPVPHRKEPIELPEPLVKDILPTGDFHLQEERRLFYVGMTRAEEELYLTSARDYGGTRPKKVSQFVMEALDLPKTTPAPFKSSAIEAIERNAGVPPERLPPAMRPLSPEESLTLSHLQVDDYETCPLKYKYVHILRVPIMRHHAVVYGSALHKAVQEYLRRKRESRRMSLDELLVVFEASWVSEGFLTREHEEQRFEAGERAMRRFFEEEEARGRMPTHVEKEFCFFVDKNRVIGRWDRIDESEGEVRIVDFKSSDVHTQKDADKKTKGSLQLQIYALAYKRAFDRMPDFVELHFLETGLVGRRAVEEDDLAEAEERIGEAARGIRARRFDAAPGHLSCKYCAYSGICPDSKKP